MADLIDRAAALNCFHSWVDKHGDVHTPDEMPEYRAIEELPSVEPTLTCDGCRHVGTYDTDFPCSGCIRREKDYYEQER